MSVKKTTEDFKAFSQEILGHVNRDVSRVDFLHEVLKRFLSFSGCEFVEIMMKKHDKYISCKINQRVEKSFQYSALNFNNNGIEAVQKFQKPTPIEKLQIDIIEQLLHCPNHRA